MAEAKGLLDNPNAATQKAPGQAASQPMQTTTATAPSTNRPKPGQAGTVSGATAQNQQVATRPLKPGDTPAGVPSPGNKPLDITDSVADYESAFGFDPSTMTVEGRLQGLMDSDNALIQRSRDRAELESAQRGLRNSSIAVQAGEEAAYSAALPIAQADAQNALAVRTAAFGAAVEDQMLQKQHGYDLEKIEVEYQNNRELADQAFGFNTQLADQSHGHRMEEGKQAGEFQLGAAQIGADAQVASASINAAASRANTQANIAANAEQAALGREFSAAQQASSQDFTAGQNQLGREQQMQQQQAQIDAAAEQGYLSRESQQAIASAQLNSQQQLAYTSSVTNVMSSTQSAIGSAAASGAKNADDFIQTIQKEGQNQIAAITNMFTTSGIGGIGAIQNLDAFR